MRWSAGRSTERASEVCGGCHVRRRPPAPRLRVFTPPARPCLPTRATCPSPRKNAGTGSCRAQRGAVAAATVTAPTRHSPQPAPAAGWGRARPRPRPQPTGAGGGGRPRAPPRGFFLHSTRTRTAQTPVDAGHSCLCLSIADRRAGPAGRAIYILLFCIFFSPLLLFLSRLDSLPTARRLHGVVRFRPYAAADGIVFLPSFFPCPNSTDGSFCFSSLREVSLLGSNMYRHGSRPPRNDRLLYR